MQEPFIAHSRLKNGPWPAFERMMERYLIHSDQYIYVENIGGSGDKGADVIGINASNKSIVIQCKFSENATSLNASVVDDELIKAMEYYEADNGVVATNRRITKKVTDRINYHKGMGMNVAQLGYSKLEELGEALNNHSTLHHKEPRDYQMEAFEIIRDNYLSHKKSSWFLMATGLGKTRVAALVIEDWLERFEGSEIAFLVPTLPLVKQTERALWPYLSKYTQTHVLTGTEKPSFGGGVTIATYDSFQSWIDTNTGKYDLIIFDEAHHAPSNTYSDFLKRADSKFLLGMTATPWRGDNRSLNDVFGEKCYEMSIVEGMQAGYLAKVDYQMYFDSINWEDLAEKLNEGITIKDLNKNLFVVPRDNAIADMLKKMTDNGEITQGIVFCPRKKHAELFASNLKSIGISANYYHSGLDRNDKVKILKDFYSKKIKILVTVDALNEGYDVPDVDLVVFLKATHSQRIFVQQLGRGLRISKNKSKVKVLDFITDFKRFTAGLAINQESSKIIRSESDEQKITYLDDIVKFNSSIPESFKKSYVDWSKISDLDDNEKFKIEDLFPNNFIEDE